MYLLWFDDDKRVTTERKIRDGMAAYALRFRRPATVVVTNEAERVMVAGVLVRSEEYIRPHNFWIGEEEQE